MPPAWVRAPSIEGPAPSTALCEATASAARSPPFLGVITAGHRRDVSASGALSAASLAGCARWGWPVSASGWREKHPITASEPRRPLGAVPGAEPARCAPSQLSFSPSAWCGSLVGGGGAERLQSLAARPTPSASQRKGHTNSDSDAGCLIFRSSPCETGGRTKMPAK
jgi:hypothetical protein